MRRQWYWAVATLFAGISGEAAADSLDINLHEEAVRITYAAIPPEKRGLEVEAGHYFNEDDHYVSHVGMHVSGENWSQRGVFDIGLGARAVYVHTEPYEEAAIAVGARLRFSPVQRLGFGGSVYYAPQIVTFVDGKSYTEASVSVDFQVLPQAMLYAGYRVIEVDFDDVNDVKLDDRAHIGMRLSF